MAGRDGGNRFNRGDGGGEGRFGRGGGRFGRGGGRERGGGGGGRNMVWMRDNDDGGSSNVDPRHGSSDKARWDADAMEQGGARGSEKWGDNSNNTVTAGAAGGRQPQAQDRRHPTPGKRNAAPLVGGVEKEDQTYFVQSPRESCEDVDVVPTPPVLKEVQARFSKRTVGINLEHVGARAEKMARKRNLQGNEPISENSFDVLSNMEIINMASHMGVNIPDDNFTVVDVIRELEKSRANIAKKINTDDKQQEEVLLITNAAGESSTLNTAWGDEEDIDEEGFKSVKSRKREKKKVNVMISKPITRSQNQRLSGIAGKTMDPGKPSNKTQSPKHKKK
ncbi:hypothetical protein D1007_44502 [Hordeum vulgare]|nr:hypothetical protein D1007_44502 [Hordeum vulgare]